MKRLIIILLIAMSCMSAYSMTYNINGKSEVGFNGEGSITIKRENGDIHIVTFTESKWEVVEAKYYEAGDIFKNQKERIEERIRLERYKVREKNNTAYGKKMKAVEYVITWEDQQELLKKLGKDEMTIYFYHSIKYLTDYRLTLQK